MSVFISIVRLHLRTRGTTGERVLGGAGGTTGKGGKASGGDAASGGFNVEQVAAEFERLTGLVKKKVTG